MFQRTPKSSPPAELSSRAEVGDAACVRAEHLLEWRDAAKCAGRAYKVWCAAGRRDRRRHYVVFLDALRREEQAARQLERDTSTPGVADPIG